MSNVGLIAPWYILEKKIRGTYGESEFVNVGKLVELSSGFLLNIDVTLDSVAKSLRAVLPETYTVGDNTINVVIYDSRGNAVPVTDMIYTAETLAQTVCNALYMNPLFVGAVIPDETTGDLLGDVVALIKPEVIQFQDGSLDNICHTFSAIASEVFTEVSNLTYNPDLTLAFNNFSRNCNISNNIYCTGNDRKPCNDKSKPDCFRKYESACGEKEEAPCHKKQETPCWKKQDMKWQKDNGFYNRCKIHSDECDFR